MLKGLPLDAGQELPAGTPLVQCGARGRVWLIRKGYVDLYLARRGEDGAFVSRRKLARVKEGELLFDLPPEDDCVPIFVPGPEAVCLAYDSRKLRDQAEVRRAREAFLAGLDGENAWEPMPAPGALTDFEVKSLYRSIIKRAVANAAFRDLLAKDPRAAATQALGRPLPEGFALRIEFERPDETVLVV